MSNLRVVQIRGKEKKCNGCLCKTCQNNLSDSKQGRCDGCMYCFVEHLEPINAENINKCSYGYNLIQSLEQEES